MSLLGRLRHRAARLSRFAKDVAGRSGPLLVDILVAHLDCALEGARFAGAVVRGEVAAEAIDHAMREIERRGDALRQQLVGALAEAIVTPLDREDLFRLSRSIDDVLDNTRDFVRECALYAPSNASGLAGVLATLVQGLQELRGAVAALIEQPDTVIASLLTAKRGANGIRRHFQAELAELFAGELTMETLKQRELLRRLDVIGLRVGEAVGVCTDALVKRNGSYVLPPEP